MNKLVKLFVLVVSLAGLGLWGGNAAAAIRTSTAAGGNWATAGTWTCNCVPAMTDTVVIATTGASKVTVAAAATIAGVTINSGATLTMSTFALTVNGPWVNNGTFTAGTATVTFGGATAAINAGSGTGNFNILQTLSTGATALAINTSVTAASLTINPASGGVVHSVTISGSNTLTVSGAVSIPRPNNNGTSTLAVGAGTLSAGSLSLGGTSATRFTAVTVSTGIVNVTGNFTAAGTAVNGGSQFTFTGAGTLNVGGATTTAIPQTTTLWWFTPSTGTVNFNGGAQTVGANTFNNLTFSGNGAKTTTGATVNGILSMEGTATTTGTVATYGPAATLQYNRATALTAGVEWVANFTSAGGIVIANTGPITMNSAEVIASPDPLTINAGATLITNNNQLTLGGNFIINNGGTFTAGSSIIVIGPGTATQSIAGFTTTGTVSMTKTGGTATFTGNVNGAALNIIGTGGTLDLGTGFTHTFTGSLTNTAGTLAGDTSTLVLGANFASSGGTFNANTGTVSLNGASAQIIGAGTVAFNTLNVANTASPNITLSNNVTVNTLTGVAVTLTSTCPTDYTLTSATPTQTLHSCPAPTITGISPTSGPTAGGTTVTITGNNFTGLTGASAVKFGSVNATSYTVNSATQITATAPPGADTVHVTVTTPGGTSATSTVDQFTYMPALFAQYLMDESGWNGTASEVKDSAGSNHGTAATLTTPLPTTANTTPAIAGSPGTCRYGVFDRTKKNYVALPSFPNLGASSSFTITAWIRTTDNTQPGQRIFIDDENNTTGYGFSLGDKVGESGVGWAGTLRFFSRGTTPAITLDTAANVIANNNWYFVAAVVDLPNKRNSIFVYSAGTLKANVSATWTGADFGAGDAGIASIGGETNSAVGENTNAFGFAGNIDEVRVYQSALSSSQVNMVRQITHDCVPPLDHLRIKHDGEGSTCAAENITVEACADPQCNALVTTGGITATLQPFGTAVSIGTSGSQTLSVSLSTAGTNTLNATSINPAPANTTVSCLNTVTSIASCTMLVSACPGGSNFNCLETSITPYSSGTANLYTKLAGTAFSFDVVGLNSLGAVETNYVVTGATAKNVTVELFDDSTSPQPATCSAYASPLASQTLSFVSTTGRNTTASFTVPNAYRKLRCRVTDANMAPTAYGCSSDDFSVRPSAATLLTSATAVAPSAASTPVIKAGANFTLGATTAASANYSGTLTLDSGKLTAQITSQGSTQQSGGVVGTLTPSSLTANATAVNATYSEVGYLYLAPGAYRDDTFTAVDSAAGDCITSTVSDANLADTLSGGKYGCSIGNKTTVSFGRFIPDHFDVSVNANGTMAAACLAGGFTYIGQAMSYVGTTLPSLTIMPMSAASGGHVTQNYQGVFQKLAASGVSITSPTADATQLGKDGATKTALAATMSAGTLANSSGTLTYTLKSDDTFTYTRDANALVGPYTSSSPLAVTAVADGEAAAAGTLPTLSPTGVSLRFGRLRLQNAYGSERLPLAVPLQAQYWAGSAFVNNTNDSCTVVSVPEARTLTGSAVPDGQPNLYFYPFVTGKNELRSTDTVPTLTSPLSGGKSNLQFSAPLKRGWLDVILNVPNYLIYNWGNCSGQTGTAGLLDDFPCARATFGIYGAKSPIIYRRENY